MLTDRDNLDPRETEDRAVLGQKTLRAVLRRDRYWQERYRRALTSLYPWKGYSGAVLAYHLGCTGRALGSTLIECPWHSATWEVASIAIHTINEAHRAIGHPVRTRFPTGEGTYRHLHSVNQLTVWGETQGAERLRRMTNERETHWALRRDARLFGMPLRATPRRIAYEAMRAIWTMSTEAKHAIEALIRAFGDEHTWCEAIDGRNGAADWQRLANIAEAWASGAGARGSLPR